MKAADIREQTDEELQHALAENAKELENLSVKVGGADSGSHPLKIRSVRRDIARIKTVMTERKRAEGSQ